MPELELAKRVLEDEEATLAIVKNGKTLFKTRTPGIKGLIEAIEKLKEALIGASVADRIVGKAVALLLAYSKVNEVFAIVLSREGLRTLKANNVRCEFENLVPHILNREQSDLCPFEKFALNIESPDEAYEKLRKLAEENDG